MKGDAHVRVCRVCHCKVFNVAEISSEDVRQLIRKNSEGDRIEARIFQRRDGTVLTNDCPRGRSHGWGYARKLLPSVRTVAIAFVALLVVAVGTITIFGDNIRRLFATSSSCMVSHEVGDEAPVARRSFHEFGSNNAY